MSGSKVSRLLCLLLSSLLVLGCFSVGVSAADEASGNLLDTNILNWSHSPSVSISYYNSIGRLYIDCKDYSDGNVNWLTYAAFDDPNLVVGHTYTASVHFPSASEINSALGTSLTDSAFLNQFNTSNLYIRFGICYCKADSIALASDLLWEIPASEFSQYFGSTVSFDFDYKTYSSVGTPAFFIGVRALNVDTNNYFLYFSNPVLKDNDADDSAGLFQNLIEFLASQFGGISTGLSDLGYSLGDKISELLSGLTDKLADVRDKINSKLDTVKEGIADSIFEAFDSMGIDLEGWFNDVGSWFTDLKNKLTKNIEAFKSAITDFFDKFKPRVYEELFWERGIINVSTGAVIHQASSGNVIVSELFEVPLGTQYNFDFIRENSDGVFQIYQYSMDGTYIGSYVTLSSSVQEHSLPQGYCYRFRLVLNRNKHDSEANSAVKIYADEGWLNALVRLLIYKIRGLFVPDPYFISDWSTEMDTFLSTHFGIIYDAGTIVSDFISKLGDLLSENSGEINIKFPAVKFNLNGEEISLWDEQSVDMSFLSENEIFATLYGMYKMILWVIFIFATTNHATHTFERILKV